MKGFNLFFLVFVFWCSDVIGHTFQSKKKDYITKVSAEFKEGTSGSLKGSLEKLEFTSGVVDLKIEGTVSADLEDERMNSTFFLKGGILNLDGRGNTINIKAICSGNCHAYMYLISATSGSLSVKNSVFRVNDHWASVMCLNNTDSVELVSCKLKGTPYQFAMVSNTSQLTISKCKFEKLERISKMVNVFDGFIFRLANCSNTKIEDCVFRKIIAAGTYNKSIIGWAAPVYMEDCAGVTISKCKFQKCTGIMAGAIYSFTTNSGNTYTDLVLKGNRCNTPTGEIMSLVSQDRLGVDGLSTVFAEYVSDPATPGNDITRIGSEPVPVAGSTCSTSKKPHYRDGVDETNFGRCPLPAGAIVALVLVPLATVVITVVGVVLCCWHCQKCWVFRYRHTPFNKQNVFPDKIDAPVDEQDGTGRDGRVEPMIANQEEEGSVEGTVSLEAEDGDSLADQT